MKNILRNIITSILVGVATFFVSWPFLGSLQVVFYNFALSKDYNSDLFYTMGTVATLIVFGLVGAVVTLIINRFTKKLRIIIYSFLVFTFLIIFVFILQISNADPDKHREERDIVVAKLNSADSVEECRFLSEQIVELGPECHRSFESWLCKDLGQFYDTYMTTCIGGIAGRQDNNNLCLDESLISSILIRGNELSEWPVENPISSVSVGHVRSEGCLMAFVAEASLDIALSECRLFEEKNSKNECFGIVAVANLDPRVCDNITSDTYRERCMVNIAVEKRDISLCEYANKWEIDRCKEEVNILRAIDSGDPSLCVYGDRFDIEDCKKQIKELSKNE